MRLTLRTLLAYLDDTLDASEIKAIGEKVAESDAAQELVARLKQVTRRRRLTAPQATGPEGADPNDVAEYLDNELSVERVSELEKIALESDVHLAEIAACHQILTLVLGEPALVPPKSKERMYGLVKGREAKRRKAQPLKSMDKDTTEEEEELTLSSGWLRWVLPLAAAGLVVLLAFAIYQVLPAQRPKGNTIANNNDPAIVNEGQGDGEQKDKDKGKDGGSDKASNTGTNTGTAPTTTGTATTGNTGSTTTDKGKGPAVVATNTDTGKPATAVIQRAPAPSKERAIIGNYIGRVGDLPSVLIAKQEDGDKWQRFAAGNTIYSADTLVALPGFTALVRTKTDVALTLRGHVREFSIAQIMDYLMDSAVILHANKDFDLDLTLLRGRIYLTNRNEKGPARIRLRFENEVWDLTLAGKGDEVAVDLFRMYSPVINYRKGEDPRAQCYLGLLRGDAELKIDAFHPHMLEADPPRWVRMEWDSFTKSAGPYKVAQMTPALRKEPPAPELLAEPRRDALKKMDLALKNLETLLGSAKSLEVALQETMQKPDPVSRVLAVYCLTSIDAIGPVIDVLGDEDPNHFPDREAAFYSLQRWVARSSKQSKLLYDEKTQTGILADKKYKQREAEDVVQFLHPLQAEDLTKIETYEGLTRLLQHRKVAIAEMGFWHLVWLSGGVKLPPGFNAAFPQEDRERYAAQIQAMIEKKQLPPMRPEKPGGG
jgi:hypothetical protein